MFNFVSGINHFILNNCPVRLEEKSITEYNKGWIYFFITIFFFSTIEVVTKPFSILFNPFQLTFLRFLIGGIFLLFIVILKGKFSSLKMPISNFLIISLVGSINSIIAMSLLQVSVKYSSSSTAAILVSANPIFVLFIASFLLKEKITLKKIIALILGITGIISILLANNTGDSLTGIFYGIIASFTFALYTVLTKKLLFKTEPLIFQTISFLGSSTIFFIILLIFKVPIFNFRFSGQNLFLLIYSGIFITGIAYITFFKALTILEVSLSSFAYLLKPVISGILAFIFLNEVPNKTKAAGTVFIIIAISFLLIKNPIRLFLNFTKK